MNELIDKLKYNAPLVGDYNKTDLDKFEDFIRYSHDKISNYNNAIKTILLDTKTELKRINQKSVKSVDKYKLKMISKKCSETLFWKTKSNELISVLNNYYSLAEYKEDDVEEFKNATQKLYITGETNIEDEYSIGSAMENVSITVMNLGYDTTRNLKILTKIINKDLGIDIRTSTTKTITCDRMNSVEIIIPNINTPIQQCRASFIIEIYNDRDEIITSEVVKDIFFRKEGN